MLLTAFAHEKSLQNETGLNWISRQLFKRSTWQKNDSVPGNSRIGNKILPQSMVP